MKKNTLVFVAVALITAGSVRADFATRLYRATSNETVKSAIADVATGNYRGAVKGLAEPVVVVAVAASQSVVSCLKGATNMGIKAPFVDPAGCRLWLEDAQELLKQSAEDLRLNPAAKAVVIAGVVSYLAYRNRDTIANYMMDKKERLSSFFGSYLS